MRIRLPLGRSLFVFCLFLLAMLALLPMRLGLAWLGLDNYGLAAREARGSVWNGALVEAQYGDAALGDLDAGLGFLPMLIGRARIAFEREAVEGAPADDPGLGEFSGAISVSGANFSIDDMVARLPAAEIFAPLPIAAIDLESVTARFENGLCVEAEGLVRARLAGDLGGVSLPGTVTGAARCDEGRLLLPLIGQSGMEQIDLRIGAAGDYSIELVVTPSDDAMREQLTRSGFQLGSRGYMMTIQGQF